MYQILNSEQRRIYTNIRQLYSNFRATQRERESFDGGMSWKRSKGREYLFQSRNRRGYGKSLGPRTEKTEKIFEDFHRRKTELDERLKELRAELDRQAKLCVASGLGRMPRLSANIIRLLVQYGYTESVIRIAGSNAMYAYEAAAGVQFDSGVLETRDLDLFFDQRSKLKLLADQPQNLLSLLQAADKSFDLAQEGHFRAVNERGFEVELIKAMPSPPQKNERRSIGKENGDLQAAEISGLSCIRESPAFEEIVIADDGYPVEVTSIDPRYFAAHKLWLSTQDSRDPVKQRRDSAQAREVVRLLVEFMPRLPMNDKALQALPSHLREPLFELAKDVQESLESPGDVPGL